MILTRLNPSPLTPTDKLSYTDLEIGIPLMLVSVELVIFAVFFHFAYSVTPYLLTSYEHKPLPSNASDGDHHQQQREREQHPVSSATYHGGPLGVRAWAALLNPGELIAALRFIFTMRSAAVRGPRGAPASYGGMPVVDAAYQQSELQSRPKHTYDSSYGRDDGSSSPDYNNRRANETYNVV